MLSYNLRMSLSIAVVCYFVLILYYLKKRMLELKYTLLWLMAGVAMGVMIFFPQSLVWLAKRLGIVSYINGLFVFCFTFIIMILMAITSIVSRQQMKIRTLIQEMSMMEKRIRELEEEKDQRVDMQEVGDGKNRRDRTSEF